MAKRTIGLAIILAFLPSASGLAKPTIDDPGGHGNIPTPGPVVVPDPVAPEPEGVIEEQRGIGGAGAKCLDLNPLGRDMGFGCAEYRAKPHVRIAQLPGYTGDLIYSVGFPGSDEQRLGRSRPDRRCVDVVKARGVVVKLRYCVDDGIRGLQIAYRSEQIQNWQLYLF